MCEIQSGGRGAIRHVGIGGRLGTGRAREGEPHEGEPREGEPHEGGGVLTLAAVPIGRAEDASWRLAAELAQATLIAAEDTRRVRWLASSLNIELKARIISYDDAVRGTPHG